MYNLNSLHITMKTYRKNKTYRNKTKKNRNIIKNYIFGYGSLISSESRKYTGKYNIGKAIPVVLSKKAGYVRKWVCKKSTKGKRSFLGLEKSKSSTNIYGVLCPILKCIENFDKREKGYKRITIKINNKKNRNLIKPLLKNKLPNGSFNVHIYTVKNSSPPNNKCPITQQYLDVILHGFLEYNKKFAFHFLKNTKNWINTEKEVFWKNDRNEKYKKKYKIKNVNHKLIDKILMETIPQYYKKRN
tara:strand:+ start:264 stop:995 length:732 start_codon:yes stop_codon:yes gene_type:complete